MAELRPHLNEIEQAGVAVAVIGSGGPSFAKGFQEKMAVPTLPIFSDTSRASFDAAGMRRKSTLSGIAMSAVLAIPSFIKHPQTTIEGSATQLGGALIIRPDGTVTYRYVSRYAGDHPKPKALVAAALSARS